MTRALPLLLLLAACTADQQAGLRRASELADKGCRAVLVVKPDSEVGRVCAKVVAAMETVEATR